MRALAAAAQAALPVNAATTAAVAEALKTAEAGAAGGLHVNQNACAWPSLFGFGIFLSALWPESKYHSFRALASNLC